MCMFATTALIAFAVSTASAATTGAIFGGVGADGSIISGSGFQVQLTPAGSGGTVFTNNADVQNGSNILQVATGVTGLSVGEWLQISTSENTAVFREILAINGDQLQLNYQWQGITCACATVVTGMTLWTVVDVTFNTPFESLPSVTFSSEATSPSQNPSGMPGFAVLEIDPAGFGGAGVSKKGFQVYEVCSPSSWGGYNGVVPPGPSYTCSVNWWFTAVGQQSHSPQAKHR